MWMFWLFGSCFLVGCCVGEAPRLYFTMKTYRADRERIGGI